MTKSNLILNSYEVVNLLNSPGYTSLTQRDKQCLLETYQDLREKYRTVYEEKERLCSKQAMTQRKIVDFIDDVKGGAFFISMVFLVPFIGILGVGVALSLALFFFRFLTS